MITLTIDGALCSALGMVWLGVAGITSLISAGLLVMVLRARMKQVKKGEEHAYRNY